MFAQNFVFIWYSLFRYNFVQIKSFRHIVKVFDYILFKHKDLNIKIEDLTYYFLKSRVILNRFFLMFLLIYIINTFKLVYQIDSKQNQIEKW